jgi:dTDP-4-amino-4,6-dideoxygalactose transaminase
MNASGDVIPCAAPREQYLAHREEIDAAMHRVLASGSYVLGEEVEAFERELADYLGVAHTVGVGSGTEALRLALIALGVGAGDEVVSVAHTAAATVAAIEAAGATPVLVDVDPATYTLDPAALERAVSPRTKAVVVVHLYGQGGDLGRLVELTRARGLYLIEDCAQALGGSYRRARLGSFGDVACFSFYPTKNLGAIGDGGAVATRNAELAQRVRLLRQYGWETRGVSRIPGYNSRLDELQAAVLRVKLRHLDQDNATRRALAAEYDQLLAGAPVVTPHTRPDGEHCYHLYVIRSAQRDALRAHLMANAVHTMIHYPVPIHAQPAYLGRVARVGSLPVTERLAGEILTLPLYPELGRARVERVASAVRSFP